MGWIKVHLLNTASSSSSSSSSPFFFFHSNSSQAEWRRVGRAERWLRGGVLISCSWRRAPSSSHFLATPPPPSPYRAFVLIHHKPRPCQNRTRTSIWDVRFGALKKKKKNTSELSEIAARRWCVCLKINCLLVQTKLNADRNFTL